MCVIRRTLALISLEDSGRIQEMRTLSSRGRDGRNGGISKHVGLVCTKAILFSRPSYAICCNDTLGLCVKWSIGVVKSDLVIFQKMEAEYKEVRWYRRSQSLVLFILCWPAASRST